MKSLDYTLSSNFSNLVKRIYWIIAWSPWIWLMLFGLFVFAIAFKVGHLPVYGQPDPKSANLISSLFYTPIILLLVWSIITTPVGIIWTLIRLWRSLPKSIRWVEIVFYLGGLGLFYWFILSDFAGLITWLGD